MGITIQLIHESQDQQVDQHAVSRTNVQVLLTLTEALQQSTRVSMEEVADIGPTIAATVIGGIIATGVTSIIITAVGCGERSEAKSKLEKVIQSQKIAFYDYYFGLSLRRLQAYHKLKIHSYSKSRNIYHVILVGFRN